MKEFALKHPILTFLISSMIVDGVVRIAKVLSIRSIANRAMKEGYDFESTKEEEDDGSSDTADKDI